jgi:hypothetical protein
MKVFILLCIYLATASADELLNIPVHKIGLPEGQALLVRCPGKSIDVKITGAKAGQLPVVELQNWDDCRTKLLTPNTLDRSEGKTTYRALELPSEFKTPVIGDLIVMVPPNQSKFAIVITRTY